MIEMPDPSPRLLITFDGEVKFGAGVTPTQAAAEFLDVVALMRESGAFVTEERLAKAMRATDAERQFHTPDDYAAVLMRQLRSSRG